MPSNQPSSHVIQIEALRKVFLTDEVETHALSDVTFEIRNGDYVVISGPSGCGKSTLLSILGLLDKPDSGRYVLNGLDVSGIKVDERARIRNNQIGFIFQSFNLIGDLTVCENVELPLSYRSGLAKAEQRRMVTEAWNASEWRIV